MVIRLSMAESNVEHPELLMVCKINSSFNNIKKTCPAIKEALSFSVDSFEFTHAGLILYINNKQTACLQVSRKGLCEKQPATGNFYKKYMEQFGASHNPAERMASLQPSSFTTIPVILRACDPASKMEIGVFSASPATAQNYLNKATSLGIHIINIIQDSVFGRQKDRNLRKLSILLETVGTISSSLNLNQILHIVSQITADLFHARCAIFLFNETDQTIIPAVGVGSFDKKLKKKFRAQKGLAPYPAFIKAMRDQQPVMLTPDNIEKGFPPEIIKNFSYARVLLIPLISKNNMLGIMQVDRPAQDKQFDHEEVAIFSAIAKETSIAMENTRLVDTLAKKEKLLQQLLEKLICAQEDERKRVASEIHDGAIQALLGIWYRVQLLAISTSADDNNKNELFKIQDLLGQQIQEIRRIVYNLRPVMLDTYGLGPALRALIRTLQEESQIDFELVMKNQKQSLPANFELTLYRIVQELLANVIKHSQATRVHVTLANDENNTVLVVKDNGIGFNLTPPSRDDLYGHLGLANIQERLTLLGGTFKIDSQLGWGTTVTVYVPTPLAN
ncbi:GAF domain-containing sensor histidine kinase [Pelotomaculum terephthalicicum JT]|uniref:GAF domain-containing sensor histidine kinase n=2 Tax=Pelotomaculum TaxID=191373 RepID=UPI001F0441F6|nr:GAF domain-containing sensor histidine kinase [Pelotomaculum terephthalicicum]MCG9966522.1 GAF domain-containing sensor histidine kinase [Pelotomaculum terephthalicicum JT]